MLIIPANGNDPFAAPPGATENVGPVLPPNGYLYTTYALANDFIGMELGSATADIGTTVSLPAGAVASGMGDGILLGLYTMFSMTPTPIWPAAATTISIYVWTPGNFLLKNAVTVQGPNGQPMNLPAGTLCSCAESCGPLAARASYWLEPEIDENVEQQGQGASARMVPVTTKLAWEIVPPEAGGEICLAEAYWVSPGEAMGLPRTAEVAAAAAARRAKRVARLKALRAVKLAA